jgi:DNA-binding NarL/FixJ family response regulator
MMVPPRVLLADDHRLLLDAFQKLLEAEVTIVGAVADGHALLEAASRLNPDIIVLDIGMPILNGFEAGRQIKQKMPQVRLIYLTVNEDPDFVTEAFQAGASAYLLKKSIGAELFQAIRQVMNGQTYVTPLLENQMDEWFVRGSKRKKTLERLTPRQREVLQLLAEGHSMKQAASILNVTQRTIAFHKYRMMEKLRLKTNTDLIQLALKENLVSK